MSLWGIDEAGLGPRLGPFCAALVEFREKAPQPPETELYQLLSNSISPNLDSNKVLATDSKKLYTPAQGIARLEKSIAIFLQVSGIDFPKDFHQLVQILCPIQDYLELQSIPWLQSSLTQLPLLTLDKAKIASDSQKVLKSMQAASLQLKPPELRLVTARRLNELITAHQGKSGAIQALLTPLLQKAIQSGLTEPGKPGRLTVDRQGGRRYYSPWLSRLPGNGFKIIAEGPRDSCYQQDNFTIEFLVTADQRRLEVALASMFAKYLREVAMHNFNCWWRSRIADLRPTAGYPRDAKRFIECIASANQMPANPDILIRRL